MKKLQMLITAVALTLLLSVSAIAGDGVIETGKTPPPPPPADSTTTTGGDTTDAGGPLVETADRTADLVAGVASALWQSALALF